MSNYKRGSKSKRKYTSRERQAYWLGVGIAIGHSGGLAQFNDDIDDDVRKSVENGFARELSRKPASAKFDKRFRGRK